MVYSYRWLPFKDGVFRDMSLLKAGDVVIMRYCDNDLTALLMQIDISVSDVMKQGLSLDLHISQQEGFKRIKFKINECRD